MRNLVVFVLLAVMTACGRESTKPNLLFIWTDEQQYFTMKTYGNDIIQTPNLDLLASESFVFEKAYVTQPVCTPDRSSVMTGLYPHTNGCIGNNIPLPKEFKILPEIINDPDYKTAYMGKWHLGNEIFKQHGFDTWVSIEDLYIKHYSPDKDRNARSDYHHWLLEKGYEPNNKKDNKFERSFAARLPLEHCKPKFLEEKAIEFLETNGQEPFMLYVNFLEPHMPFFGPLDSLYNPEEVILPCSFNDFPDETDPEFHHSKQKEKTEQYASTEAEFRDLIARYWGLVSQVDISVGAILDKLESLGLSDNTIVVFTSDHGDMMGAHRMVTKGVMYEEAVRIPFLLRDPRLNTSQRIISERISQIDIVPTLLDLMGWEIPGHLQGKSLVPGLEQNEFPAEDIFIEWNAGIDFQAREWADREVTADMLASQTLPPSIRTIISTDGWKLSLSNRGRSQLFDLNKDPLEINNLFYQEANQEIIKDLSRRIHNWQKATGDTIPFPGI